MFELLQGLPLLSLTNTTLIAGTGLMIGALAGAYLPLEVVLRAPRT